jgi:hypothetical protein
MGGASGESWTAGGAGVPRVLTRGRAGPSGVSAGAPLSRSAMRALLAGDGCGNRGDAREGMEAAPWLLARASTGAPLSRSTARALLAGDDCGNRGSVREGMEAVPGREGKAMLGSWEARVTVEERKKMIRIYSTWWWQTV